MPDSFFSLTKDEQAEALLFAASTLGRPAHLLEKDLWVVWTLQQLFSAPVGEHLTFKGGTSLSKVYRLIDRFSEDIDLTYDIRQLIPELTAGGELPASRAQTGKWVKEINTRLPGWIDGQVVPVLNSALERDELSAELELEGDKLYLRYLTLTGAGDYVRPAVLLEFGARSSGDPNQVHTVKCDAAEVITDFEFPQARPAVLEVGRTMWEKVTAAHVYCAQERLRGERFARHWHDLAAIARSEFFPAAAVSGVATLVAQHKSWFFREKDVNGVDIDYSAAVNQGLRIVPTGQARQALADDYAQMVDGGMMIAEPLSFDALMDACAELEAILNSTPRA